MKVGKKGKKAKPITTTNGLSNELFASLYVYNEESVSLTAGDGNLYTDFAICIDESLVVTGNVLEIDYELLFNNATVSTDDFVIYEGDGSDHGTWDTTNESALTFEITDKPDENLILGFSLSMFDDVNYEDTTQAGKYEGTADVKYAGASVTEPCPTYDSAWPTLTEVNGATGSAEATISGDVNLPADAYTSNENFNQYSHQPDGFGGMFYWGYPGATWEDNPNSVVSVVHLDGDTPNNSLAEVGEIVVNTGKYGYFEIARFGEDGQNWFTLVQGNKGAYKFASGTMSMAGIGNEDFTGKALNGLCGRGFTAGYVAAVSAATVDPLLQVYCANGAISKSVLAKAFGGKLSVVTTLGTGTKSRPCVVTSLGTDTRASGTEAALIIYTRVSSKDVDGYCGPGGATISSRSITTVTAALVATSTRLNTSPWTGRDEPAFLSIAAGSNPGTWFGVSNEMVELGYSPHFPAQLFSMTGTAITIESDDIALDESTAFGDWSMVTPFAQLSPTQWSFMITGSTEFDGDGIGRATIATINPDTGAVSNGDILEMTGMGNLSSRIIARFSSESDGNATMYTVTGAGTYKSTVWNILE